MFWKDFMKQVRDLFWIIPSSLVLGLAFSLLGPGTWWIGWLAYFVATALGLLAISALWRSTGSSHVLLIMMLLAVFLRMGLGIAFSYVLPASGNDTFIHKAGYVVRDAYSYDNEAWKLASSGDPLWRAFDTAYKSQNQYDDQYGGLLFFHSLIYRFVSPDAQRPWLLILISALACAIGAGIAWKGVKKIWGEPMAWIVAWIMALYPESLLAGSSAVREPFLILFSVMIFWGLVDWLANRHRPAWAWMAGGTLGLLLFSPGTAVAVLFILGIWAWLGQQERRIKWWWFAGIGALLIMAIILLGEVVGGALQVPSGPLSNLLNWLRYSINYSAYVTWHNSGWLQRIFSSLPEVFHVPFIIVYGIAQPVLPAAIVDDAVWPMRVLGILRGLGWYALLPFLVYVIRPIFKTPEKRERLAWLWLFLAVWVWIILASARAGGDQWDNPRYRMILLFFEAGLAGYALYWARQHRDPWLWRILAVEGVFLLVFLDWYGRRFIYGGVENFSFVGMVVLIISVSVLILAGGWVWDKWLKPLKERNKKTR
jgi:hypothetical protein